VSLNICLVYSLLCCKVLKIVAMYEKYDTETNLVGKKGKKNE
jgi:hypothetical protein